jgi:imidazolonepropionase-like amidohydrolase
MKVLFTLLFLVFLLPSSVPAQGLVIRDVNVIQTDKGEVKAGQYVWIENGLIKKTGPDRKWKTQDGTEELNASGQYLMPGLIDGHVHYFQSGGLYTRPDVIDLRQLRSYDTERQWLRDNAEDLFKRYLAAGITHTCDVGGPMSNFELREEAKGKLAPELLVTGPLISSYQPEEFRIDDPPIVLCETAEEARALVRKQLPLQPDFIKIWFIVRRGEKPSDHLEVVKATIEESHAAGIPVAVHATQLETARLAVQNGCDILVHSVDDQLVDEEFTQLLVERGVSYIPTLIVSGKYDQVLTQKLAITEADLALANPFVLGSLMDLRHIDEAEIPGWVKRLQASPSNWQAVVRLKQQNLKTLYEAGVNVVSGTDAGNIGTLHASSYFEELAKMAESGLSPGQVLKASTYNPGRMLERQIGLVSEGYEASLLLLSQNPLEDLKALRSLHTVIHQGQITKTDSLLPTEPVVLAQRQLNAYNLRNLDAFVECYHPEVKIYHYPDQLSSTGREAMRKNYGPMFERTPDLHCELVNRLVIGNQVVDKEKLTGFPGRSFFYAAAIYTVENGLITEVRFMR